MSKNTSKHPRISAYIPHVVLDRLREEARTNRRSVNNQLVICLEQCLGVEDRESDTRVQNRTQPHL